MVQCTVHLAAFFFRSGGGKRGSRARISRHSEVDAMPPAPQNPRRALLSPSRCGLSSWNEEDEECGNTRHVYAQQKRRRTVNLSAIRLPPPLFPPLLSHHVKKSSIRPLGKGKEEEASPLSSPALLTHEKEEESSKEEGGIGGGIGGGGRGPACPLPRYFSSS